MIRITIEVDELEEAPSFTDQPQYGALRSTVLDVVAQLADGQTRGYVEDDDGAPCAAFRVDEGLPGPTLLGTEQRP